MDSVSFGNIQWQDTACFDANDTVLYVIEIEAPSCTPSRIQNPVFGMSANASHSNIWNTKTMSGVNDLLADNAVEIYPNPFTSQTTISLTREEKNATIKITDVLGKEVKNIAFSGKRIVIERGELQTGIYSLQVISEKGIIGNEKIVIQ
jgi:hypothetical protein